MNRKYSKADIQLANRHVKRCLTSLIIREVQIKTMLRYHHTSVRMGNINNTRSNRCWWGCRERGTLWHCWWECKLVQPVWRTVWKLLRKLTVEVPDDPAMALLDIYPKDTKVVIWRSTCTPMFIYSRVINNSQTMERAQMSMDWWMDKEDVVHIYNQVLLSPQKEWTLVICNTGDGTRVYYYAKWRRSVKAKQTP